MDKNCIFLAMVREAIFRRGISKEWSLWRPFLLGSNSQARGRDKACEKCGITVFDGII